MKNAILSGLLVGFMAVNATVNGSVTSWKQTAKIQTAHSAVQRVLYEPDRIIEGDWGQNARYVWNQTTGTLTISGTGTIEAADAPGTFLTSSVNHIVVEDGITGIGKEAFQYYNYLRTVVFADSVTTIGEQALAYCNRVESVVLPARLTKISKGLFSCDAYLCDINIPETVTEIEYEAFYTCTSLTSVTLPEGLQSIDMNAFVQSGITELTIPGGVTLESAAIVSCPCLKKITVENGVTEIPEGAFGACSQLETILIPDSVTTIGAGAFSNDTLLRTVVFPDSVETIEGNPFYKCTGLQDVYIPESVSSLEDNFLENASASVVLHVVPGSYAAKFAENFGLKYDYQNPPKEKPVYAGQAAEITDVISFRLAYQISEYDVLLDKYYVEVTYPDGSIKKKHFDSGRYIFDDQQNMYFTIDCPIPGKLLGGDLEIQVYDAEAEKCGDAVTASIRLYCEHLIETSNDENVKAVAASILSYGYEADRYFSFLASGGMPVGSNNPLNGSPRSKLSSSEEILKRIQNDVYYETSGRLPKGVHFEGLCLDLEAAIGYCAYFRLDDKSLKAAVEKPGNELISAGNGLYYIEKHTKSITELSWWVDFSIGDFTVSANPLYYIELVLSTGPKNTNTQEALHNLCIALEDYYEAVYKYVY